MLVCFGPQELQALCRQAETTLEECVRSSFAALEHSPGPAFVCYSCVTHPAAKLRKLAAQQRTPILVGPHVCWSARQDATCMHRAPMSWRVTVQGHWRTAP